MQFVFVSELYSTLYPKAVAINETNSSRSSLLLRSNLKQDNLEINSTVFIKS